MRRGNVSIVLDPLYGDSGKGKIAAVLAARTDAALAIEIGTGPSAGHEIHHSGRSFLTRLIPPCYSHPNTLLAISRTVAIDLELLDQEVTSLEGFHVHQRLLVDPECTLISCAGQRNLLAAERAARSRFCSGEVARAGSATALLPFLRRIRDFTAEILDSGRQVIAVMQHGTCVTSAFGSGEVIDWSCTTQTALQELPSDCPIEALMVVRTMPSRTLDGPLPHEITWPAHLPPVYGKSSGKLARIASEPDYDLLAAMCRINQAVAIYVTFGDFLSPESHGATTWQGLGERLKKFVATLEARISLPVLYISTGPGLAEGVWIANAN